MIRVLRRAIVAALAMACVCPGAADDDDGDAARAVVDEVSRDVAEVRGLAFTSPVAVARLTPDIMRRKALDALDKDWPEPRLRADERALKIMGALPPGYDLRRELVDLLTVQAAGMYDLDTGRLLVAGSDLAKGFQKVILSHELAHALQDRHFNLARLLAPRPGTLDRDFALSGLIEGEATLVMMQYVARRPLDAAGALEGLSELGPGAANRQLLAAPPLVRHALLGPYIQGMGFVSHFHDALGWKRIDGIYADPPLSGEQVLHPKKYYPQRDFPQRIDLVRVPAFPVYRRAGDTTLGEMGVRAMVESWGDLLDDGDLKASAGKVAAGWDGDRLVSYQTPDGAHAVVYWISTWDTPADAVEMQAALSKWTASRPGTPGTTLLSVAPAAGGATAADVACTLSTGGPDPGGIARAAPAWRRTPARTTADLAVKDLCP